ncbi:hypothetical protein [Scytonema sp. UIC 10036]|uniref:hypothetical protein n=1 Tax=Scytonema sp. UIC 10036 TaxID=2304196 RepID=UPI001A9C136F|nr:hypothetical protein [Scytonema sp. UIC 10036]
MTEQRISDLTVEELKALVTSTINERLSAMKASLLQEIAKLIEDNGKQREEALVYQPAYVLPKRTKEEQLQINQALIEWHRKWVEEGDEEEQRETFEYLQKALDEDRLSNRPLFPQK